MSATHRIMILGAAAAALAGVTALATGQIATPRPTDPPPPPPLRAADAPEPPNLFDFVQDKQVAILLGKALFWDMQVGSDGMTACATCHFHAGTDSRSMNQMNPGTLQRDARGQLAPDRILDKGANAHLTAQHFPLRKLNNADNRASGAVRDTNDIVSSQGVFDTVFQSVIPGQPEELVLRQPDPIFNVNGLNVRQVQPRQAPSVINAVFNHRNFWDGRAQNEFNGVNQWGDRDQSAMVLKAIDPSTLMKTQVRLINSSLASQAVAPVLSAQEMSADGRTGPDLANKFGKKRGKKLGSIQPLAKQLIHPEDSVLGAYSRWPSPGVDIRDYETLIMKAFRPDWWKSNLIIRVDDNNQPTFSDKPNRELTGNEYTLLQYNFSLFFGLALQLYQATLVSDDTPYDRSRKQPGTPLSKEAEIGLQVFVGQSPIKLPDGTTRAAGRCINCHAGPEFTDASVASINSKGATRIRDNQAIDRGYNNIGVRPTLEDLGVGGTDPSGVSLSITRSKSPSGYYVAADGTLKDIAVDGSFKAPGLRNVELTAPYFHNGGHLTLESVMDFYSRGGDFAPLLAVDGTLIQPLTVPQFSKSEKEGLVALMKALTDERVRNRRAPFDHPQLFVPNGQLDDHRVALQDPLRPEQARDRIREIPAVGRTGGTPLPNFLQRR